MPSGHGHRPTVVADWRSMKLTGPQIIRDLWRQKDLGIYEEIFTAEVAAHGVILVKLKPATAH
ncbi:MAG: hypothetical protein WCS42_24025 [Verrucomicrobiota bacterium]